ncbi:restriction endonuclease [Arthrobacter jiangjiafuii]|uniref:Restriction endonuclease n=1 Tax=Arthrobacter jiangjiafuii TaxID=2817475 RepID=A0A975M688_9MICC|nr:restriction endonuclease [Arthrobacter jiangjiafuii]MBP3043694.1 restriction endonuclease [Arthrobacter jiangjiafuii]QWC10726.1 restriction endonuclease [Arthrobacter jiangjiafuii]
MTAWLVRAGSSGEREQWALENGYTGAGYGDVGSLVDCTTREAVMDKVSVGIPNRSIGAVRNFSAQLWALKARMKTGDLVVMPLKRTSEIAIGTIDSEYTYLDTPDPERRHIRRVTWRITDLARSRVKQDLLYSLGAFSTVCQIERNDAEHRLRACISDGADPGARVGLSTQAAPTPSTPKAQLDADELMEVPVDVSRYAADAIASRLIEAFSGHKMEGLIADILRSAGYVCTEHGEGTDDGIDIVAGKGILGLEPPRLIVQVKSQASPVDSPTVSQLHGSLAIHGADQGLLVAWGGLTRQARKLLESQRFAIRVWDADEVVAQLQEHYSSLPARVRRELPLKQIWTLADEAG